MGLYKREKIAELIGTSGFEVSDFTVSDIMEEISILEI